MFPSPKTRGKSGFYCSWQTHTHAASAYILIVYIKLCTWNNDLKHCLIATSFSWVTLLYICFIVSNFALFCILNQKQRDFLVYFLKFFTLICYDCWKLKLCDKRPLVDIIHIILASQIPWPTKGPTLLPLLDCTRSLKKGKAVSDLENLIPDEFFPLSGRNVSPTGSLKLAYIKLRQKGLRSYFSMKSMLRYLPDSPWWKDTHDVFHRIRKPNLTPVRKNRC